MQFSTTNQLKKLSKFKFKYFIIDRIDKKKEREEINIELKNGNINLIVGTHTLIEEKIIFKNLGLAIIDEQHRFGVAQRSRLWKKNLIPPHILIMSATPIPRTLSMTLYGDVDISSIKELPPGEKKIKTYLRSDSKRLNVFKFISSQIKKEDKYILSIH